MQGAKANREAYQQLASQIAGYASAIAQAVQSDPHFSPEQPGSDIAPGLVRGAQIREVESFTRSVILIDLCGVFVV